MLEIINYHQKVERKDLHLVTVMIRAGFSSHGNNQVYFIEHGATITSNGYIEHIIESLIKYDILHFSKENDCCIRTVLLVMLQKTQCLL